MGFPNSEEGLRQLRDRQPKGLNSMSMNLGDIEYWSCEYRKANRDSGGERYYGTGAAQWYKDMYTGPAYKWCCCNLRRVPHYVPGSRGKPSNGLLSGRCSEQVYVRPYAERSSDVALAFGCARPEVGLPKACCRPFVI